MFSSGEFQKPLLDNGAAVYQRHVSKDRKVRLINHEPTMFLYSIYLGVFISVSSPFLYFKVCVEHSKDMFTESFELDRYCKAFGKIQPLGGNISLISSEAIAVQTESAHYSEYIQIACTLPAVIASFFIGAWSDRHGRKPPLVIAMFATVVNAGTYLYSATFITSPVWLLLISNFINGMTGGGPVVFQLVFSATRDSYPQSRIFSVRLSLLIGISSLGMVLGAMSGGCLVERYGYRYVLLLGLLASVAAFFQVIFGAQETLAPPEQQGYTRIDRENSEANTCGGLHVLQALWTLWKPRAGRRRFHISLGLFAFLLMVCCDLGRSVAGSNLMMLYFKLPPFMWSDSSYMYYTAFVTGCFAFGIPFCTWLLKLLAFRDSAIVIVGLASSIALFVALCLCRRTFEVILASSLSVVTRVVYPGFRAHLVMLVPESETGRLFSLVAAVEIMAPMLASFLFNNIYPLSLAFFPGLVFAIGAGILTIDVLIMVYVHCDTRQLLHASDEEKPLLDDGPLN